MNARRTGQSPDGGFQRDFARLAAIGRDPSGAGYRRFGWTREDRAARRWFAGCAARLALTAAPDRNGNLWAWWGDPAAGGALVLGSHLDTVPNGGAYDGALGVVAGFAALRAAAAELGGARPARPVAVAAFVEEEGSRFGVATLGSRLLAGSLEPAAVLDRRDPGGTSLAEAMRSGGSDPAAVGADEALLGRISEVVELHIEQGRALADLDAPLAVGTAIHPHGRWRFTFTGRADHAGTTRLADRRDPALGLAAMIGSARAAARAAEAVATVGRLDLVPNAANAVPGRADGWLDVRAGTDAAVDRVVAEVRAATGAVATGEGLGLEVVEESRSPGVRFDPALGERLAGLLTDRALPAPGLPTAAGHDAGALAARVPAGMLFVRNPSGVSHSPEEWADPADCLVGVGVLTDLVLGWVRPG